MLRWRAILFDLDDTLYPERDYVLSGLRAVASWAEGRLGIPTERGFLQLKALFERGVRGNTFDVWVGDHGRMDGELVAAMVDVYRTHQPALRPFPEVPALLTELRRRYLLGLVSDGYGDVQRRKLMALGVARYFDAVVLSDELGSNAWKPSPQPFIAALERLGGIDPRDAVYVADNPTKDFLGARRAGLASIRVRRLGGEYARLDPSTAEHEPDMNVPSLTDLELQLQRLASHGCRNQSTS
jgi:putative hydrolase of the HAD superfamily